MNDVEHYNRITVDAMKHALGLYQCLFQLTTISHIIKTNNRPSSSHHIQTSILVQGTSGGLSSVFQIICVTTGGVMLTIESMLSLSFYQMSKIKRKANTTDGVSYV